MLISNKTIKDYWIYTILIMSVIVFLPGLQGDFLNWDDTTYITDNEILNKDIGITSFLELYEYDSYISLSLFSFQVQKKIFGNNPFYFHLINILVHLINILLVFNLVKELFRDKTMAFWVAIIFAVHPFRVESVAWIMQRKDLLYSMFFFTGILTYIQFLKTDKIIWFVVTIMLAYLAIMNKASAVSFVFIIAIVEYYKIKRISLKSLLFISIIVLIQLSNIYSVALRFIYILLPILYVRMYNKTHTSTKNSKNSGTKIGNAIQNLISFLAEKKTFKYFSYFYIIIFITNILVRIVLLMLNQTDFSASFFILESIAYFMPVIILLALNVNNQFWINSFIKRIKTIRKPILIASAFIVAVILLYLLAKPHYSEGEYALQDILSFKTIFYFSFSLTYYLLSFIFPFYQNGMIPYPEDNQLSLLIKLSPIALLILGLVAFYLIKKVRDKDLKRKIIFGLLYFILNIILVLHLIPIKGRVIVAERYSYMAYLGLIIVMVSVYTHIKNRSKIAHKRIIMSVMIVLTMAFSLQSFSRSFVFKNSYSFWSDIVEKNPNNHYAIFSVGLSYYEKSDYVAALKKYSEAINIDSTNNEYYINRGSCYFKIDSIHKALSDYNKAIELNSLNYLVYKNRGILYFETGDFQAANIDFEFCLDLNSQEKEVIQLYKQTNGLLSEYSNYETSGNNSYNLSNYYFRIATDYAKKNDYDNSITMYNESLKYNSLNIDALKNRGNIFAINKDYTSAILDYQQAIDINPDDAGLYLNLGNILHQLGDINTACERWSKASILGNTNAQKMIDKYCK